MAGDDHHLLIFLQLTGEGGVRQLVTPGDEHDGVVMAMILDDAAGVRRGG